VGRGIQDERTCNRYHSIVALQGLYKLHKNRRSRRHLHLARSFRRPSQSPSLLLFLPRHQPRPLLHHPRLLQRYAFVFLCPCS
jgi:hypothetical protein